MQTEVPEWGPGAEPGSHKPSYNVKIRFLPGITELLMAVNNMTPILWAPVCHPSLPQAYCASEPIGFTRSQDHSWEGWGNCPRYS